MKKTVFGNMLVILLMGVLILAFSFETVGRVLTTTRQSNGGTSFEGSGTSGARMPGDINMDGVVDGSDLAIVAWSFGSRQGYPRWNPVADENGDGVIDGSELAAVARNYGKAYTMDNDQEPTSLLMGWRSSEYGHQQDRPSSYWISTAQSISSKIPGSSPGGIWVIGEILGSEPNYSPVTFLSFPSSQSYPNIRFDTMDRNEAGLTAFDSAGLKVWLQVEPADADIPTLVNLVLGRYGHHPCVIGFGVDAEWYLRYHYSDGKAVTNSEAQTWLNSVKSHGNYTLFIKHFDLTHMPTLQASGLVYIDDSQGFSSLGSSTPSQQDTMMHDFTAWGQRFSSSEVYFQIGYEADRSWWSHYSDPVKTITQTILDSIPNCKGVYWVDDTITDLYP